MFLPVHIAAAAVGLISGAVALSVAKGGRLHRRSGVLFVYAIITMCVTAILLATAKGQVMNVVVGLLTSYLVITAVITVRPPVAGSWWRDIALMVMALVLGLTMMGVGFAALASPTRQFLGYPAVPLFLFGVLGLSGAFGDFKTMRAGTLRGAPRLSRHVWRMCMALAITTISFVSIRARVAAILPAPLVTPAVRILPVVLVLVAMFYGLWRVRFRRTFAERWPGGTDHAAGAAASASYRSPLRPLV